MSDRSVNSAKADSIVDGEVSGYPRAEEGRRISSPAPHERDDDADTSSASGDGETTGVTHSSLRP